LIDTLLLAVTRVTTQRGDAELTNATGFFFRSADKLFLITARHVIVDEPSGHCPDSLTIEFHTDPQNVAATCNITFPLHDHGHPIWRESVDAAGLVDVAAVELNPTELPSKLFIHAFTERNLIDGMHQVEIGTSVLNVAFPLGFHDTLHHLPVVRHAVISSVYGLRFQGQGYFLTDGQMHRGSSGAPVVMRAAPKNPCSKDLPWVLLGIHALRMDVSNRDFGQDGCFNLNCAWYSNILVSLTQ
jgi:hypothetical protein